jgi:copper chaperone CopZ
MTITRFHVAGMDCAAEEQVVRMVLSDVDGIERIEVDLERRDVVIDHSTSPDTLSTSLRTLDLGARHVDDTSEIAPPADHRRERNALVFAFVVNAGFFIGELTIGLRLCRCLPSPGTSPPCLSCNESDPAKRTCGGAGSSRPTTSRSTVSSSQQHSA